MPDDLVIGQNLAGILGQKRHDFILVLGQMNVLSVQNHPAPFPIHQQAAASIGGSSLPGTVLGSMAQCRPYPGQQLGSTKGLGDVVVRAQIQRRDFIPLMGSGRHHKNGHLAPAAHLLDEDLAVQIRQSQIQQHQIRAMTGYHHQSFFSRSGHQYGIAIGGQNGLHKVTDVFLVLHDQHIVFIHGPFPPTAG